MAWMLGRFEGGKLSTIKKEVNFKRGLTSLSSDTTERHNQHNHLKSHTQKPLRSADVLSKL